MEFIGAPSQKRYQGRTLPRALAISVALHGLIFGATASLVMPTVPPVAGVLQAVLGEARSPVPKASTPNLSPRPQGTAPAAPAPALLPRHEAPPVMAVARGGAESVPVRTESVAPSEAGTADSSRGERGVASGAAASGERSPVSSPAREGMSADALRQYRMALGSEARRYKRYPRLARERGWQGVVEVTVHLGAAGAGASLGHSSGFAALDEQAVDMIAQATRQTPLPEALRGRELSFVLPVQFSLDD